ncbi:cupredoxin domain-containing protein [Halorussus sp. MSC15.2]|uniref:cupredoxin domain-containing protein n=1 Tax=Halorussus sp. MSC15.2 TaxID=2283638 RepID=UPI001967B243|nr:cupredoxin domain-containing protein [Halorussus sp. MSC15.2]
MSNDSNGRGASRRRFLRATAGVGITAGLGGAATAQETTQGQGLPTEVQVKQDAGRLVYWVLPGKRRLSKKVFGTPENPKQLVEPVIEKAKKPAIKELLRQYPFPVGVPLDKRAVEDGEFTTTTVPTAFSDEGRVIDGEFELTYHDRDPKDSGKPTKTEDAIEVGKLRFTDPKRNNYELDFRTIFAPPIPEYQTGGGVFTDRFHHGLTDTGSPLMPKVYTYGASYSLADVIVNGTTVSKRRVTHWMTTQTVRTDTYNLAIEEDLPLRPENTIAGRLLHTHLIVLPIKITKQGKPKYAPLDGIPVKQKFIHVMFEENTLQKAPFEPQYPTEFEDTPTPTTQEAAGTEIEVTGQEYTFDPEEITVEQGNEVTIRFRNVGTISHNFKLPKFGVKTDTILPGRTASVTFTPEEVGKFTYVCGVPGHAREGMRGTLVVTP